MATYSYRISKLEAVNTMLTLVGDSPVNTLSATTSNAQIAELILDEVTKEFQYQGWHFNTENNVTLPRDNTNKIEIPDNALSVDVDDNVYPSLDVIIRGNYLYNKNNHTYEFSSDLKAEVIYFLTWDNLPEIAKRFVVLRAGRIFSQRLIGSAEQNSTNTIDENQALRELVYWDEQMADLTIWDNYSVSRVLDR
jgi:Tail tubular protein